MRSALVAMVVAWISFVWPVSQAEVQDRHEVRLALRNDPASALEIGARLRLELAAAYRNAPAGARLYVALAPLNGTEWSVGDEATLSATNREVTLTGTLGSGAGSLFRYGPGNFPASMSIAKAKLAEALGSTLSPEGARDLVETLSGGRTEVAFHFAFLAALGRNRDGQVEAALEIQVPSLPYYYDGIEIMPALVVPEGGGQVSVRMTRDMRSISLRVTPDRPRPTRRQRDEAAGASLGPSTRATIRRVSGAETPALVGRSKTYRIQVAFEGLVPGTAVYVAPMPKDGEDFQFEGARARLGSFSLATRPELLGAARSLFAFAPSSQPIRFQGPLGQQLEAARLFVADAAGGVREGELTLTPPAFPRLYGHLELMLAVVVPSDSGLRVLVDTERLRGMLVPVE